MGIDLKALESEFGSKDSEAWKLILTTDEPVSLKKLVTKICFTGFLVLSSFICAVCM